MKCIKCGNNDIYIRYRKEGDFLDDTIGEVNKGLAKKECLYNYCRICSYWWIEETKDVKEIINYDR